MSTSAMDSTAQPSVYCTSQTFIDAVNDSRFVRVFGVLSLANILAQAFGWGVMLGLGLAIMGYGTTKYYRTLGFTMIALLIGGFFMPPGFGTLLSSLVMSGGVCWKSWTVMHVLGSEGKGDPDWPATNKRALIGLFTSGFMFLVTFGFLGLVILGLIVQAVR